MPSRLLLILTGVAVVWWLQLRLATAQENPGLFPIIFNLATRARITTNATCGESGPETYCRLVEHVPMGLMQMDPTHAQCQVCDLYSQLTTRRYGIYNAIDGTNSWWQSPSLANGKHYHWVTITLDLGQVFNIAYIIIKAANSPRPGNWILEHSTDGVHFTPWQYYAISDAECLRAYGVAPTVGMHRFVRDDEVICTSYYSQLEPLSNGEIHISLVNGRPSMHNPSETLMKFLSAKYIKLRLQKIRTLHGGLMAYRKDGFLDQNVHRRYFYSIKDISIGGQCICFGHASTCIQDPDAAPDQPVLKCVCEHNTCGESCNECCPGFVQKPWQPGSRDHSNQCEPCNCHGHSETCYYEESVDRAHESLDIHGNYEGGGVCVGCRDYTTGNNCEMCIDGTYRPLGIEPNDPQPCVPCDCSTVGTRRDDATQRLLICAKDDKRMYEGMNPGDCFCKPGYAGQRCDQCARGYFGYPYCQPCQCNLAGSSNPDACAGPCQCKENVIGLNCDQCKPGYFNLNEDNDKGCNRCFCFGLSTVCESVPWGIVKVRDMTGWFVTNQETTSFLHARIAGPHMIAVNHQEARRVLNSDVYFWLAPRSFLGNKLTAYGGRLQFTVSYRDQPGQQADPTTDVDVILQGNGITVYKNSVVVMPDTKETIIVTMTERDWRRLTSDADPGTESVRSQVATQADFMSVLSGLDRLLIRAVYSSRAIESRLSDVSLDVVSEEATDPGVFTSIEQCVCPASYEGLSCESCEIGYRRVDGVLLNGICKPCQCNNHATECSDFTGECFDCDHNTTGPHCEFCAVGFFGYPVRGTIHDCQPCRCPLLNPENNFSPTCVADSDFVYVCSACLLGYTGPRCERCADGFYGDPLNPGSICRPCLAHCNDNINPDTPDSCSTLTGQCLICVGNTSGSRCEYCRDGFFGDAIDAKNCQACCCDELGSTSPICNRQTGQCDCKPNVIGRSCDQCAPGFWNLGSMIGCQSCNCNPVGSLENHCDVVTGQCRCKPGVTGMRCNQCQLGHWNFSETGCQACDCEISIDWCNPITGQCSCPPNTIGQRCDRCDVGHWDYDIHTGCKPCICSPEGSSSSDCDLNTGQCRCKRKFVGQRCDQCPFGYRDFPKCKRCRCSKAGTDPATCQGSMCSCADEDGQCVCKINVKGKKCDKCADQSFSLQSALPEGCTRCFCFGVTGKCKQTSFIRKELPMSTRTNDFSVSDASYSLPTQRGVTFTMNRVYLNATEAFITFSIEELFWNLPVAFTGNKVLSYGGILSFTVTYKLLSTSEPEESIVDVKLIGTHYTVTMDLPNPSPELQTPISIKLIEHNFKLQPSGRQPTREEFMMILQDMRAILIRATYGPGTISALIGDVVLDVAGPVRGDVSGNQATGVEQCDCPSGYSGLSCERCEPGFFRLPGSDYLGTCVPCTCYGHSDVCDGMTGECQGCQHNTTGPQCNICDDGFYGESTHGSPTDCMRCACPSLNPENNFSPTCVLDPLDGMHNCTDCQPGYVGRFCDSCDDGYFGNPTIPRGTCQPCDCNEHGSVSTVCNTTTGDCLCSDGITGERCDQCDEGSGYIVTETGCSSCYNNCTGLLLTKLDILNQRLQDRNFSNIVIAPWDQLREMENATGIMKGKVVDYMRTLNITKKVLLDLPDVGTLLQEAYNLTARTDQAMVDATQLMENAMKTTTRAMEVERNLTETLENIKDVLREIHNIEEELQKELSLDESSGLLVQARQIVKGIADRTAAFDTSQAEADFELGEANKTLELAKVLFDGILDLQSHIDGAFSGITNFTNMLEFLIITSNEANKKYTNAIGININSEALAESIQNLTEQAESSIEDGEMNMFRADDYIEKAWDLLELANASTARLRAEFLTLSNLLRDLEFQVGVIEQNSFGLAELVQQAKSHASRLRQQALHLEELFQPTKDYAGDSIRAVNAYGQIVLAIQEAELAAGQAMMAANNASYQVRNPQPLDILAILSRDKSLALETDSLFPRVENLKMRLQTIQDDIAIVTEKNNIAEKRLESIHDALPPLKQDLTTSAQEVLDTATGAVTKANSVKNKAGDITRQMAEEKNKLQQIKRDAASVDSAVDAVVNATGISRSSMTEIRNLSLLLSNQADDMRALQNNMAANLSEIREKIRQARNQASKIKVSMYSTGDCARSYKPEVIPSIYNTLVMNVKIISLTNMLFYIKSNHSDEFMILETVNGQPTFRWNVGSDTGSIKSTAVLQLNQWYKIEARRISHTGTLKVQKLISTEDNPNPESLTEEPVVTEGMSAVGSSVLDVDGSSLMFVGGIPTQFDNVVHDVESREFRGCMAEVILDDKPVGLWNFKSIEGTCQGCGNSPSTGVVQEGAYNYDGTGYSIFNRPSAWNDITPISFALKTQAEEALLFFMASQDQRDFLAIELKDGYLIVSHDLGSGTGKVSSLERVNTNSWVQVSVVRRQRSSHLFIGQTSQGQGESPGNLTGLTIGVSENLYVGGVPSSYKIKREVTSQRFYGCIKNFQLYGNQQNLLQPGLSTGVEDGCIRRTVRSLGLLEGAQVIMRRVTLGRKADIALTFTTRQRDGMLLAAGEVPQDRTKRAVDTDQTDIWYAIGLVEGRIRTQMNAGQGLLTLTTSPSLGYFSDARPHVVLLEKDEFSVRLIVDDIVAETGTLPGSQNLIPVTSPLYIGSVPSSVRLAPGFPNYRSITGCMKDLVIMGNLVGFESPSAFSNATIGKCAQIPPLSPSDISQVSSINPSQPKSRVEAAVVPAMHELSNTQETTTSPSPVTTPNPLACAVIKEPTAIANAVRFGLSPDSHIQLSVDPMQFGVVFSMDIELRTLSHNKLIFHLGSETNPRVYCSLHVKSSYVLFAFSSGEENGKSKVLSRHAISDGQWHAVHVQKNRRKISLTMDNYDAQREQFSKRVNAVQFDSPLYVGGVPPSLTSTVPGVNSQSFEGCIRKIRVNDIKLDLSLPLISNKVAPCFMDTEPGANFQGSGYALLDEQVALDINFILSFKFRTAQEAAVLLSVSFGDGRGLALEMINRELILRVVRPVSGSSIVTFVSEDFSLCDNKFHTVYIVQQEDEIKLLVDDDNFDFNPSSLPSYALRAISLGGYPERTWRHSGRIRVPFKGCIQDFRINLGIPYSFSSALELVDVIPDQCPTDKADRGRIIMP